MFFTKLEIQNMKAKKLHYAIYYRNLKKVIKLVENGYNIEEIDDEGYTPL